MNIDELIANAGTSDWLTESFSETERKNIRMLSDIAAAIELKRKDLGLNQKEFAKYMGVTQGMVSKWESGEYNFSLTTLLEICEKLDMEFDPLIRAKSYTASDNYKIIPITARKKSRTSIKKSMIFSVMNDEVMANES